jgi:peptidoglycan/xylan/chitin deacetylase (PgdA/CDA1 family)
VASVGAGRVRGTVRDRAQSALKRAAGASDRLRPWSPGIVMLAYHRVGCRSTAREIDLPTDRFDQQMELVVRWREALALDDALAALRLPFVGSRDRVVVTFDDGTADFVDVALPILERHRVPATLYVATRFVEDGREFPDGGKPLSWAALRDAVSTGLVTLGSHTHSHALLDRISVADAASELERSIELLQERTGVEARHFAYPKALVGNAGMSELIRATFSSAAVAGTRANRYGRTDPWRLARSPVQRADGMKFFEQKLTGGLRLEDDVRRLVNRVRYIGAST